MPIKIYRVDQNGDPGEEIAWLCGGEWLLDEQIHVLAEWLVLHSETLPPAEYVADIGFCWRRSAAGGGPVLDVATMQRMVNVGMTLFFSEYPGFAKEEGSNKFKSD